MAEISVLLSDGLYALYARCRRETGYCQTSLVELLELHDGRETARRILQSPPSEDFKWVCELRRPDLTVEAFILSLSDKEQFFCAEELSIAATRIADCEALVRTRKIAER